MVGAYTAARHQSFQVGGLVRYERGRTFHAYSVTLVLWIGCVVAHQVEEHLAQGSKAMQHMAEEASDHAAGLGALLHARAAKLPTLHKHTVCTLLLQCTYQRDLVARLVELEVLELDDIEWSRCIRC